MSVTQDLVGIVERMFECFDRGDIETIRQEIFAPDIVWMLPGRHPLAGTMHGTDEVLAFFQQLSEAGHQVKPLGASQFPDNIVVAFLQELTTYAHNGAQLNINNCLHCQIVNGKIQRVQVYVSDQYGADDYFNVAFKLRPIPDRLAL
jgi:uncharacterized protein